MEVELSPAKDSVISIQHDVAAPHDSHSFTGLPLPIPSPVAGQKSQTPLQKPTTFIFPPFCRGGYQIKALCMVGKCATSEPQTQPKLSSDMIT